MDGWVVLNAMSMAIEFAHLCCIVSILRQPFSAAVNARESNFVPVAGRAHAAERDDINHLNPHIHLTFAEQY